MNRSRHALGRLGVLLAALLALGFTCSGVSAQPATAAAAGTMSLTAQTAYYCEASAAGSDNAFYTVTMRMQLDVPTSVQPGQSLALGGVLTLQFDETLYRNASLAGVSSVDGYSPTLSATSTIDGQKNVVLANRWQTSPAPLRDPIVVSAPVTFPAYTVPADASGDIALGLPQNGTTKNIVSNAPSMVAWTGVANAEYAGGTIRFNLACNVKSGQPGVLGKIPVTQQAASGAPAGDSGTAPTPTQDTNTATGSTAAPGGTTSTTDPSAASPVETSADQTSDQAGNQTGAQTPGTAVAPGGPTARAPVAQPGQTVTTVAAPTSDPASGGLYLPTGLLVLSGAAVCFVAVAYAGLTNYRLRMIQKAMDG